MRRLKVLRISGFLALVVLISLFQNCAPMKFSSPEIEQLNLPSEAQAEVVAPALHCFFKERRLEDGEAVTVYKTPTVAYNDSCISEERKCTAGILSGTYEYETCTPDETRKETLTVQQNTIYNPFKLLIVVDDSYTMSQSQAQLSANLDSLLTPLRGMNVDVKVVTTSDQAVAASEVQYFNSAGEVAMTKPLNSGVVSDDELFGRGYSLDRMETLPYLIYPKMKVEVTYKEANGSTVSLLDADSASTLNQKINRLKGFITRAGVNGSDSERALCPVLRHAIAAQEADKNSFFQKNDKVAFLVLSDENDQSAASNCLQKESFQYSEIKRDLRQEGRTVYTISDTKKALASWTGESAPTTVTSTQPAVYKDGILVTPAKTTTSTVPSYPTNGNRYVNSCETALAELQTLMGKQYTSLTVSSCSEVVDSRNVSQQEYNEYRAAGGKNSSSWVSQPIYSKVYRSFTKQDSVIAGLVGKSTVQEFDNTVLNEVKKSFGENYFFSFIVAKSGTGLAPGQSYGVRYESLEKLNPKKVMTSSIKAQNYSLALGRISEFISNQMIEKYPLEIPEGAKVVEVKVGNIILDPSKYSYANGFFELKVSLKAGEKIEVRYTLK